MIELKVLAITVAILAGAVSALVVLVAIVEAILHPDEHGGYGEGPPEP